MAAPGLLSRLKAGLGYDVAVTMIIPTRVTRTVNAREIVEEATRQLGNTLRFLTAVPEAVAVSEATVAGQPVTEYAPDSPRPLPTAR